MSRRVMNRLLLVLCLAGCLLLTACYADNDPWPAADQLTQDQSLTQPFAETSSSTTAPTVSPTAPPAVSPAVTPAVSPSVSPSAAPEAPAETVPQSNLNG